MSAGQFTVERLNSRSDFLFFFFPLLPRRQHHLLFHTDYDGTVWSVKRPATIFVSSSVLTVGPRRRPCCLLYFFHRCLGLNDHIRQRDCPSVRIPVLSYGRFHFSSPLPSPNGTNICPCHDYTSVCIHYRCMTLILSRVIRSSRPPPHYGATEIHSPLAVQSHAAGSQTLSQPHTDSPNPSAMPAALRRCLWVFFLCFFVAHSVRKWFVLARQWESGWGGGIDGAGYSNERAPLVTRLLMQRSLKCSTRPVLHLSASGLVKLKHWPGTKKHLKELEFNIQRLGKIAKETEMGWPSKRHLERRRKSRD